jgi:hypothetical protein
MYIWPNIISAITVDVSSPAKRNEKLRINFDVSFPALACNNFGLVSLQLVLLILNVVGHCGFCWRHELRSCKWNPKKVRSIINN